MAFTAQGLRERDQAAVFSGLKAMLNFDMVGVNDNLRVGGASSLTAVTKAVDRSVSTLKPTAAATTLHSQRGVPVLFSRSGAQLPHAE